MTLFKKVLQLSVIIVLISALSCCGKSSVKPTNHIGHVHFNSATELASSIRRGEITSIDLLNLYLDRIKRYNDDINAVVALDIDASRMRANEADKALAEGKVWGPLHGVPMTVKDVFEVVGMPTTSGDPKLKGYLPKRNAMAVQRLIDAGAIIFGKTNVPYHAMDYQSYNKIYGTTNNPWDLSRTPGGSSGGSAAALAAGFTPLELGSDMGGSISIPAHYTGIFGHKPTFGIVPRYGHIPPMPGEVPPNLIPTIPLLVVGPLSRDADDLELALKVLMAPGSDDESANRPVLLPPRKRLFNKFRVAVRLTDSSSIAKINADVLSTLQKAVAKLRNAGLYIDETARPNISIDKINELHKNIRDLIMMRLLPLPEWLIAEQKELQAIWASFFENYDVLLAPVSPTVAFPHNHIGTVPSRSLEVNGQVEPMSFNGAWARMAVVSGLPVTVAPVGLSDSGLPVGIQIIGDRFEDQTTLAFARGLSEILGGFVSPPGYKD
jgi:amidase